MYTKLMAIGKRILIVLGILLLGWLILKGISMIPLDMFKTKTETDTAAGGKDLESLFLGEKGEEQAYINECGQFADYFDSCLKDGSSKPLYDMLNTEALLKRSNVTVTRDGFTTAFDEFAKSRQNAKLILKDVAYFGKRDAPTSPNAIITAVYAEPSQLNENEADLLNARTLVIYVFSGDDGHIAKFYIGEMENHGFGAD